MKPYYSFSLLLCLTFMFNMIGCNEAKILIQEPLPNTNSGPVVTLPPLFTKLLGAEFGWVEAKNIAVDSSGNSYIIGETWNDLSGISLIGSGDAFVAKYDNKGIWKWTRFIGMTTKITEGNNIAVNSNGDVFAIGLVEPNGPAGLHGETPIGTTDTYLIKFDTNGGRQWTRLVGVATKYTHGAGVAASASGDVYITGSSSGNMHGVNLIGAEDAFLIKYNTNGIRQWTRLIGAASAWTNGVAVRTRGTSIYLAGGTTAGTLNGESMIGAQGAFIIRYDESGSIDWTRITSATGQWISATDLAVDSNEVAYLLTNIDTVVSRNNVGNLEWERSLGFSPNRITADSSGNTYVSGDTDSDLNGVILTGTRDAFVVKFKGHTGTLRTKLIGSPGNQTRGRGIAIGPNGRSFISGHTRGDLDNVSISGSSDMFVTNKLSF